MSKQTEFLMQFFEYEHLPEDLQQVSRPFHDLACVVSIQLPENQQKHACLQKLVEAKDCAVRANLADRNARSAFEPKVKSP